MSSNYGLTFSEKVRKWKREESEKLRSMTFRGKVDYIISYYKGWILLGLILLMFLGYAGEVVVSAHKEIVLEGFFTNDNWNLFDSDRLKRDYLSTLDLERNQSIIFDDDLYISMDGDATEYTAASRSKIIAYMTTGELDFVVAPENVLEYFMYRNAIPMRPFDELLPPELLEELQPYLSIGPNPEREDSFIALDLSQSRYVAGSSLRDTVTDTYYMFIPYNCMHPEQIVDYICFLFDLK